jgi:hypothetical protein
MTYDDMIKDQINKINNLTANNSFLDWLKDIKT